VADMTSIERAQLPDGTSRRDVSAESCVEQVGVAKHRDPHAERRCGERDGDQQPT
jgi:hypothetical protein